MDASTGQAVLTLEQSMGLGMISGLEETRNKCVYVERKRVEVD